MREIGADEARLEEDTIRFARQALMREMARSVRPERVRRRRRAWAGIGIGGLVAGAAVTAIVAGSVLAPVEAPSASAADVLNAAADVVIQAGDTNVPAGKYLRITTTSEGFRLWDADTPEGAGEGWERFNGLRSNAEAVLLTERTSSLYVPADRSGSWVRVTEPSKIVHALGSHAQEALTDWAKVNPPSGLEDGSEVLRADGGAYETVDGIDGEGTRTYFFDTRHLWAEMPTADARDLVTWLRTLVGEAPDSSASDSSIVETLVDDPTFAVAPAEVRAASLRALALLDGSSVESVHGDVTTIRFEWSTKWWTAWKLIDIDTARGLILKTTSSGAITGEPDQIEDLPGWESRSTYDFTVVDEAP
ncbi:hypothetical protein [Microbacterium sp. SD291]|uniref:hypothetical protein n=1 Tax=Microbacterium sp. SD291 TaxID=2782007 RepID=UPI001A972B3F|nr:hypothetical protein [Microbacterium sp. SD291]MBO0979797.1 hypothetical protein [Microbacterium sp. SD291]